MSEYFRKPIVKTLMLKGEKGDTGDSDYQPAVDALGKRIDNLILSSGNESSAEVVDARTGYDGTAHDTLGTAIRNQISELKGDLDKLNDGGLNLKDEVIEEDINNWLDKHPEATTTLQDGAITEPKIYHDFLPYIKNEYVTPEMFGAKGDGVTDDTKAFQDCFDYVSNNLVAIILSGKKYFLKSPVFIKSTVFLYGNGSRIISPNGGFICTDYSPESIISDIFITSNNKEYFNLNDTIYGLYLGGGHLKLNNVTVSYFTYGIYITSKFRNINQTGCFITNCHIRYTDYALYVNDTGNYATDYTIDTCTLAGRKFGLYTDCGIGYIISNVHTWGGLEIALYIVNANLCQISNCYFETCSIYGIDLLNCKSGNVITNINYITGGSNNPFIWIAGNTSAPNSQRILLNNIYIDNRKNTSELKAVLISGDGNGRVVSCSNINSANDFLLLKNGASNTKVFIDGTNISNNNLVIRGNNVSSGGYGVTLHSDSKEIRLPCYSGVSFNVEFFICSRDNSNSIRSFNYVQAFFTSGDGSSLYHSDIDMSNAGINYETRFDTNSHEIVLSFTSSLSNYISINARPTLYVSRF